MKFLYQKYKDKLNNILQLRYGCENPKPSQKALFSIAVISKYLNISKNILISLEQFYFRQQSKQQKSKRILNQNEIENITSTAYLKDQSSLSLDERVAQIQNENNKIKISKQQLRQIYKKNQIKKKVLIKQIGNPKKYTEQAVQFLLRQIQKQLLELEKDGYIIFQLDESIFKGQDNLKYAWSKKNENIQIHSISNHNNQYQSVLAAISTQQGKIQSEYKVGYFKKEELRDFIKTLKRQNIGKKVAIFLDNSSVHHSKLFKNYCYKIKVPLVFNIPYKPEYNGIEKLWGYWKHQFKKQMLNLKVQEQEINIYKEIKEIELRIKSEIVINCCKDGWRNIFKSMQEVQQFQNIKLN